MPDMNLFASRLNKQLNKFVLLNYNPESYQVGAFSVYFVHTLLSPLKCLVELLTTFLIDM